MTKKDEMIKVEYVIPTSMQDEIAKKIKEQVVDNYWWNVTKAISDEVISKFETEGYVKRIAEKVIEKIKISEDDFIEGVTNEVKDALMKTTGIISAKVLEKVQEAVNSYGFIKVGR